MPARSIVIVDRCFCSRDGLQLALGDVAADARIPVTAVSTVTQAAALLRWPLPDGADDADDEGAGRGCLVIRLPDTPQDALSLLLTLGEPGIRVAFRHHATLVLSPYPLSPVLRVLLASTVTRWTSVGQPVDALCRAVLTTMAMGGRGPAGALPVVGAHALTARERQVLQAVLSGQSMDGLAPRMGVSSKTLYTQRRTALLRLGVNSMHDLFRCFLGCRQFGKGGV